MSAAHKEALAKGRAESAAVRAYLEALEATKRGPGRQRTPDSINKRLRAIDEALATPAAHPLHLNQEKIELEERTRPDRQSPRHRGRGEGVREGRPGLRGAKGHQLRRMHVTWVSAEVLKEAGIAHSGVSRP